MSWPRFNPQEVSWYSSVRGSASPSTIVRLELLGQLKNPVSSWGIEPALFRLVA
jgi:hypothetical protein